MFRTLKTCVVLSLLVTVTCFLPVRAAAKAFTVGGTGWSIGITRIMAQEYRVLNPGIRITVPDSVGSSGGIRALLAGSFEASFATRPLRAQEQGKGLETIALVRTPFVLAVSDLVAGPLSLSDDDVRAAYDRRIRTWPDGTRMRLVLRPERETNNRMLRRHFPGIEDGLARSLAAQGAVITHTDQEAMDYAERVSGALVTTTLAAIHSEDRALQPIALNGVAPTIEALDRGDYPLSITLYAVLRSDSDPAARAFITFLASRKALEILRGFGCSPATP